MTDSTNPRWIALQILFQVVADGRSLDDIFNHSWYRALVLDARDLALCRELVFGLCRWYFALKKILASRLRKPLRARDRDVEIMLLLGLYQLLVMHTEQHAAVNETVKLAQLQQKPWARGLINALLRNLIRDGYELDETAAAASYPDWIVARADREWGTQALPLLQFGNQRPPMILRVDTQRLELGAALEMFAEAGIAANAHGLVETAIQLELPCEVTRLPGFADGLISVQDAAAQIAAPLLHCEPGARVLDACAAPGGKSAHLLQHYDSIQLDLLDISEIRLQRVTQNLQRIGKTARIICADACSPDSWFNGTEYDYILADVPCSASGVLRRHPDIKLLRRDSDIMALLNRQRKILDALWRLLKPGGTMLYSTCSVFKQENEIQIAEFLQRHADAGEMVISPADWGQARPQGRQILTGQDNMDGFYYALLSKADGNESRRS